MSVSSNADVDDSGGGCIWNAGCADYMHVNYDSVCVNIMYRSNRMGFLT